MSAAVFSDCGTYRYRLERHLQPRPIKTMMFLMVNPSTADATKNDATIRKCMGFAGRAEYARLLVGNKFAFRSTDIKGLRGIKDAIGADNDNHLFEMMREADLVVAGWGQLGKLPEALRDRWKEVVQIADRAGKVLHCIGVCDDKHPRHPLMVGYDTPIMPWDAPWFPNRNNPKDVKP